MYQWDLRLIKLIMNEFQWTTNRDLNANELQANLTRLQYSLNWTRCRSSIWLRIGKSRQKQNWTTIEWNMIPFQRIDQKLLQLISAFWYKLVFHEVLLYDKRTTIFVHQFHIQQLANIFSFFTTNATLIDFGDGIMYEISYHNTHERIELHRVNFVVDMSSAHSIGMFSRLPFISFLLFN